MNTSLDAPSHPVLSDELTQAFFRELGYSYEESMALTHPENYDRCMRILSKVITRVERVIAMRRSRSGGEKNPFIGPFPPKKRGGSQVRKPPRPKNQEKEGTVVGDNPPITPPPPLENKKGVIDDEVGEKVWYRNAHHRLFPSQRDGRRFFRELAQIRSITIELPVHPDAWLYRFGYWHSQLALLERTLQMKDRESSTEGKIARFLGGILPHLREDHEYLARVKPVFHTDGGEVVFESLFDCFHRIGEGGGSQVISPILSGFERAGRDQCTRENTDEKPRVKRRTNSQVTVPHQGLGVAKAYKSHEDEEDGLPISKWHDTVPSQAVLDAIRVINTRVGSEIVRPRDLIENAFGTISFSAHVGAQVRERLSDLFPGGYFDKGILSEAHFVTERS